MTTDEFVNKYEGKKVTWGGYSQCVSLYRWYCKEVLEVPQSPGVAQGAKQIWDNYLKEYFTKIPNTPNGIPQKGDVVIWGATANNKYGHVALALDCDVNVCRTFDQNFPTGSLCRKVSHSYRNLLGWIRPILEELDMPKIQDNVTVSTKGQFNSSVDLAITKGQRNNYKQTRIVAGDSDWFDMWVDTAQLEIIKVDCSKEQKQVTDLQARITEEEKNSKAFKASLKKLVNAINNLYKNIQETGK